MTNGRAGRFRYGRISPPRLVNGHSLRLAARASGWRVGRTLCLRLRRPVAGAVGGGGAAACQAGATVEARWAAGWMRLAPTEVMVGEGDGRKALTVNDPTDDAWRPMRKTALVVALLGLAAHGLLRLRR